MPNNLLGWLMLIERRPGIYLGSEDIRGLRHFLDGYCLAKREQGMEDGRWLYNDFRLWLADRYQDSRSLSWEGLVLEHEGQEHALSTFYRLLHEFLDLYPVKTYQFPPEVCSK